MYWSRDGSERGEEGQVGCVVGTATVKMSETSEAREIQGLVPECGSQKRQAGGAAKMKATRQKRKW